MTTQAVTDIKELVGEMPARGCECMLNCCGSRHGVGERCGSDAKFVARVHVFNPLRRCSDDVGAVCIECLDSIRAWVSSKDSNCPCCGLNAAQWVGPVMPL